jgi:hypothetical protein
VEKCDEVMSVQSKGRTMSCRECCGPMCKSLTRDYCLHKSYGVSDWLGVVGIRPKQPVGERYGSVIRW